MIIPQDLFPKLSGLIQRLSRTRRGNSRPGGTADCRSRQSSANPCTRRRLMSLAFWSAVGSAFGLGGRPAQAGTYYDPYGNVVVINTVTLVGPVTVYDAYRRPIVIYPTSPVYIPGPRVYGPAGIRGQSRRVGRRTSRRVSRRR